MFCCNLFLSATTGKQWICAGCKLFSQEFLNFSICKLLGICLMNGKAFLFDENFDESHLWESVMCCLWVVCSELTASAIGYDGCEKLLNLFECCWLLDWTEDFLLNFWCDRRLGSSDADLLCWLVALNNCHELYVARWLRLFDEFIMWMFRYDSEAGVENNFLRIDLTRRQWKKKW